MSDIMSVQIAALYAEYAKHFTQGEHLVCSSKLHDFTEQLQECGLLLERLDWSDWYQNSHLIDRPEYIGDASLQECQLLLTAMTRLERFSTGLLDNMHHQGVLLAILERLTQVADGQQR